MKGFMKKTVVCALLCVAMAAGFLAGCGNFETSDNAEQETTEEEKTEEVEICITGRRRDIRLH